MDPLSTIASVIALAQGVAASKHVVNLIKGIPEVQNDYQDFQSEVRVVSRPLFAESWKILSTGQLALLGFMATDASSTCTQGYATAIVHDQLKKLLEDLRDVEMKCSHEAHDGNCSKAKTLKWILMKDKIQHLRDKATRAKQNLSILLVIEQQKTIHYLRQEYEPTDHDDPK